MGNTTAANRIQFKAGAVTLIMVAAIGIRLSSDWLRHLHSTGAGSGEARIQLSRGQQLYKTAQFADARIAFEQASRLAPGDAQPYLWLARLDADSNQPNIALHLLDEALRRNADDSSMWRFAGDLFIKVGDRHSALKSYRQATVVNPKDATAWKDLGILERSMAQPVASLRDLGRSATLDPDDFETEVALSQASLDAGDVTTARPAIVRALALEPTDARALLASAQLAMMRDISPASLAKAAEQIDAATRNSSTSVSYLLRGRCELLQQRYAAAISDLKEASRRDPHIPAPHAYLSQAYSATHQTTRARKEADAYLQASARLRAASTGQASFK